MDLETAKKQLRNLQFLKDDEEKLLASAKRKVKLADKDLNTASMFSDRREQILAKNLLKKYLDDYVIETIADKNTLKQLIYFEVIQYRLQEITNSVHSENKAVPLKYLDSLHKNSNQIISLKQTLGITHEKDNKGNLYQNLGNLMKKFAIWRKENIGERTIVIDGKVLRLKLRVDKYEVAKHPFFKGRFLTNKKLLKLYKEALELSKWISNHKDIKIIIENGLIFLTSGEDKLKLPIILKPTLAEVLEVSTDYIDFIVDKIEKD